MIKVKRLWRLFKERVCWKKDLLVFLIFCVMRIIERGFVNTALCQLEFPSWSEFQCSVNRIQLLFVNYKYRLQGCIFSRKIISHPLPFFPKSYLCLRSGNFLFRVFFRWSGKNKRTFGLKISKEMKKFFPKSSKNLFWKYTPLINRLI